MAANHNLGCIYASIGDNRHARLYHEKHADIAVAIEVVEEEAIANAELQKVYNALANLDESKQDYDSALEFYRKAIKVGSSSLPISLES